MTRAIGLHICFYEMDRPKIVKRIRRKPVKRKWFRPLQYKLKLFAMNLFQKLKATLRLREAVRKAEEAYSRMVNVIM